MKSLALLLLASLFTVGCGGGAVSQNAAAIPPVASSPAPTPPPPPTPPTPPTPPPDPTPPPSVPSIPQSWNFTDLPPIAAAGAAQANALNNSAHIVGYSVSEGGSAHATLWRDGSAIDIGGPGTFAIAINDSDQIVGYRQDPSFVAHAHLWPDDIDLGSLPGFNSSIATAINKFGVVVGVAFDSVNQNLQTGFTWTPGAGMQAIPGCASAEAINDAGQIAGISTGLHATICGEADFGQVGAAGAINNLGQAVGFAPPNSDNTNAWLFPSVDIGPTLATGINDYGWVCGNSVTPIGGAHVAHVAFTTHVARLYPHVFGTSQPWIWSQDTGIVMLPNLVTANAMNQSGQIVGAAVLSDGSTHGGLLTGN